MLAPAGLAPFLQSTRHERKTTLEHDMNSRISLNELTNEKNLSADEMAEIGGGRWTQSFRYTPAHLVSTRMILRNSQLTRNAYSSWFQPVTYGYSPFRRW